MKTLSEIRDASDAIWEAKKEFERVVARLCPVGSTVDFEVRHGVFGVAEVLWVGGEHVGIKNLRTGKEYRIFATSIYHCDHDPDAQAEKGRG